MKHFFRLTNQRSVTFVIAVYIVLIVLVLLWASQLLGTASRNDPAQTPALLALSLLFPAAFLVLSSVTLGRVIRQKKAGAPGSGLRFRLIGYFALTVVVTALPISILSALFLRTSIGLWLAPGNGKALEAGEELAREYHGEALEHLGILAESNYLEAVLSPERNLSDTWAALRDIAPWLEAMQVRGPEGERRWGNPSFFVEPEDLEGFPDEGPLPRKIGEGFTILSWQRVLGEQRVILSSALPMDFENDTRTIALALDEWRRYDRLKGRVGGSLTAFGVFLAGPLVLMALLIGMVLSDRVLRPLVTLGEATRKISEGDFSFRVLAPREDELAFLTQSFNMMIRELEVSRTKIVQTEKVAAWQLIAQRLAHELRNPLTPIKLSAQRVQRKALEDKLDSETAGKSMDLILREVDGLDKLLQDFRAFAGGGSPKTRPLALRTVLEEAVDRFRSVAPAVDWTLIPGEGEPEVEADEMQMRQVLVNLLKNAMEAGSSRVICRIDPLQRGTAPYARLQIRDDGEGIPSERVPSVFQPYESTRDRGSGLGLAVAQRIIYDHQGRIWFESEPGTGTVFYIDLPAGEGS